MVNFNSISFEVSEHSIVKATGLATDGNKWFKKFPFEVDLSLFLLSGHETLDRNRGIHRDTLKEEWRPTLGIIQRYVTCEGRIATIFRYRLRFLLHVA